MRKIICPKCGVEMRCTKTGTSVEYDCGYIYSGDRFGCPECGNEVVITAKEPMLDKPLNGVKGKADIQMREDQ